MRRKSDCALLIVLSIIISLCSTASAASNQISYNFANIDVCGTNVVVRGEDFIAPNGQEVPTSILYTDSIGGYTNYLSLKKMSQILDADIRWNNDTNTVEIGMGGFVLSVVNPPFTELSAEKITVPKGYWQQYLLKSAEFKSESAYEQVFQIKPEHGKYILIDVTNRGDFPVSLTVFRDKTIGERQNFPTDVVYPNETGQRLFIIDEASGALTTQLGIAVAPLKMIDFGKMDVVMNVQQIEAVDNAGNKLEMRNLTPLAVETYRDFHVEVLSETQAGMDVSLVNNSNYSFLYDESFMIESFQDGQWMKYYEPEAVVSISHVVRGSSTKKIHVDFPNELPSGRYRICKSFSDYGSKGTSFTLVSEFQL